MYQKNRTESTEIYPHKLIELIFNKGEKTIRWRNDSLFNKDLQTCLIKDKQMADIHNKEMLHVIIHQGNAN
jgi:hypothetical protein